MKNVSKTVWHLCFISLFTDMASEMLYPIMPLYLSKIGFSIAYIGLLEGVAEAIAGISKGYFGAWSDNIKKRVPFVRLGYALSALSKPLIALNTAPLYILAMRVTDRIGKGIRTGARDAILNNESQTYNKATIFGLHRSMDTLGAVVGPCIALLFLYCYEGQFQKIFLLALIPGLLSIVFSFLLKEKQEAVVKINSSKNWKSYFGYWKESSLAYKKIIIGLLLFALINSSDVFLLLKAKSAGLNELQVIGVYIFYNLIFAVLALPIGKLADKFDIKKVFIIGLALFACVYFGMAFCKSIWQILLLFFIYGIYSACTDGISKAWIAQNITKEKTATAMGLFTSMQSLCVLLASTLAGIIWQSLGAQKVFLISSLGACIVILYFLLFTAQKKLSTT